jgi:ATP-dependent Lhr-like helicase
LLPCVTGTVADRSRASPLAEARLSDWFAERGWRPFAFQRRVWRAAASGSSGLLHAGTGSGKTLAVWFGALLRTLKGRAGPPEDGLA